MKRVGITSNLEQRRQDWENSVVGLTNWQVRDRSLTYDQAQARENEFINRGYEGHGGGERKLGYIYSVYTFEYIRKK